MAQDRAISVTEAMTLARGALENVRVRVVGEVSELSDKPGYKAAYFTVCDSGAAMPCLMWRDAYAASGVTLRCGMLVEIAGGFSAYVPKGRMQFQVRSLALAGEGTLRLQVAELARRLEREGLMAPERRRPLPRFPQRIAVVTSPRGKAVHDVLRTLRRRYPLAELLVAGVAVEGASAPDEIARGIAAAVEASPDVVLLVRGGGSYEDLMPFNSEVVARAVAASPVPVVTGIGHEPDTSVADMVADLRASTPTAAAEACAPSVEDLSELLSRERRALGAALRHRLESAYHQLRRIASRPVFTDPHALLGPREQALDVLGGRLRQALPARFDRLSDRVDAQQARLLHVGRGLTDPIVARLGLAAARLDDLSPLKVLARGYAVAYTSDGRVLQDPGEVTEGDSFSVRVARGRIEGTVTRSTRED